MAKEKDIRLKVVCEQLGIARGTYLNYEEKGIFPKARRDGRGWRIFTEKEANKLRSILKKEKL